MMFWYMVCTAAILDNSVAIRAEIRSFFRDSTKNFHRSRLIAFPLIFRQTFRKRQKPGSNHARPAAVLPCRFFWLPEIHWNYPAFRNLRQTIISNFFCCRKAV